MLAAISAWALLMLAAEALIDQHSIHNSSKIVHVEIRRDAMMRSDLLPTAIAKDGKSERAQAAVAKGMRRIPGRSPIAADATRDDKSEAVDLQEMANSTSLLGAADHAWGLEGMTDSPSFVERVHGWGLEAEHSGDQSHWDLTTEDRQHREEFLKEVNNGGSDICYKWHDLNCCKREYEGGDCYDNCSWTWSETTKAGARSPRDALIGHLIHRHGLGALLASSDEELFETFHDKNTIIEKALGHHDGLETVSSSIEKFPAVAKVKDLLLKMTLGGIRHLHSYDHTWSTLKGTGKIPGCGRSTPIATNPTTWGSFFSGGSSPPGNCALQAETSEKAHRLLTSYGFNSSIRAAVQARADAVENNYPVEPSAYFMDDASHTGQHWIGGTHDADKLYDYARGKYMQQSCEGETSLKTGFWSWDVDQYIEGVMCWEAGGTTHFKIPISSLQKGEIEAAVDKEKAMMKIIDEYIQEKKIQNVKYIVEKWLTFYAGEDASFSATYEVFKANKFTLSSPDQCQATENFENGATTKHVCTSLALSYFLLRFLWQ